ncbi:hypothetical protein ACFPK9_10085 [Rubritalea spongiae]|uniref:Uncharacterized protein n=1 Tax=Rubritalea spongiae TaxID=430797 RepID=A0ABW5DZG3_9BACT
MQYFYDLSLLDVRGELASAITVLYHGEEAGEYSGILGGRATDLKRLYAIEIDLTMYAVQDDGVHSYALMLFKKDWKEEVWRKKLLEKKRSLERITTRVKLSAQITDNPPHEHHLFTASNRYIDFAPYPEVAVGHNVPEDYVREFNQRFDGYLMRSERSFEDVRALLKSCNLVDDLDHGFESVGMRAAVKMAAYSLADEHVMA